VVTVHTRGVDFCTASGCRGLTLGWRRATLVYPTLTGSEVPPERAFGGCALPSIDPLFVEITGAGINLALEPSYCGLSAGRYIRSAARLPMHSAATLQIRTQTAVGPDFSYITHQ